MGTVLAWGLTALFWHLGDRDADGFGFKIASVVVGSAATFLT